MYAAVAVTCGHVSTGRCERCELTLRSCVTDLAAEAVNECEAQEHVPSLPDLAQARIAAKRFITEVSRG